MILIEDLKGCEKKAFTEVTLYWWIKRHFDSDNLICLWMKSSLGKEDFIYDMYARQSNEDKYILRDLKSVCRTVEAIFPGIVVKLQKVEE